MLQWAGIWNTKLVSQDYPKVNLSRLQKLHQTYFHTFHFTPISLNKISLQFHKTNLSKAYLASSVKSWEHQLLNKFSFKFDNCLQEDHIGWSREEGRSSLLGKETKKTNSTLLEYNCIKVTLIMCTQASREI